MDCSNQQNHPGPPSLNADGREQNCVRRYTLGVALCWTLLIGLLLTLNVMQVRKTTRAMALDKAEEGFKKDAAMRQWSALHGGVYVPATEQTPPNPHLAHVPDRDITKPDGTKLTLMNSAYMIRQFTETFGNDFSVNTHITSLKLLRPENKPDPWERAALQAFENGQKQITDFTTIDHVPILRLAEALTVQQGCLKCHAKQGYRVGDVRGGVMVTLPMTPYLAQQNKTLTTVGLSYGGVWLLGLIGMGFAARQINRRIQHQRDIQNRFNEKNELFQTLFDQAPYAIIMADPQTQRIIEFNEQAHARLGYSRDEFADLHIHDLQPVRNEQAITADIQRVLACEEFSFETQHVSKTGELMDVLVTPTAVALQGKTHIMAVFQDITESKRASQLVQRSEQQMRTILEHCPVGVVIVGRDRKVRWANQYACKMVGVNDQEEMCGRDASQFICPAEKGQGPQQTPHNAERTLRRHDGTEVPILKTIIETEIHGEPVLLETFVDITELKKAERELAVAATTDKLTGLPNRMVFMDRLEQRLKQSKRDLSHFAVLFFDFDRFKVVNDSLGHKIGDALLRDVADIFRRELRSTDAIARFGGDEFVVLLDNLSDKQDAVFKANRLLDVFAEPHDLSGHRVVSTASIGLVTNALPYNTGSEMIRDADAAMYQAKAAGKGRVVSFDHVMHDMAMDRLQLEDDMRTAIHDDEFELYYQPIIDLTTGSTSGFEALIRWNHEQRGLIDPNDFIPIAEETGLIIDLGRWVSRNASRQIAEWNKQYGKDRRYYVNVNLSRRELLDSRVLDWLTTCRQEFGLDPGDLRLEITESTVVDERAGIIPLLRELREHGFQIVMDDFGTGLSSLGALHDLPIDMLKIDKSFIESLDSDRSFIAVVAAITSLAENLGLPCVAEGIESERIVGALQSINCTWGQGFHFAYPMPAPDIEAYLARQHDDNAHAA